ncbi:MAG TPA: hypothetical protein DF613_00220 [Lachnospiraceae bacterium]|nr:hypothetical protein [Lachnospiraceae bacterium]
MKMLCKVFSKKLFGVRYERLGKNFFICAIVFWGLHLSGIRIPVRPFILYLMVSTLTVGIMWQALSSEDHRENMKNMFMLPFEERRFTAAYVTVLGIYTFFTRTIMLLAVVFALAPRNGWEAACVILCVCHAVAATACVYTWERHRWVGVAWAGIFLAAIMFIRDTGLLLLTVAGYLAAAVVLLGNADAYAFYRRAGNPYSVKKTIHGHSVGRYLLRYLMEHKNYLANTAVMWGAACVLPALFGELESGFVLPVGFAILSFNTPVCILLSCDPALEQAVRFLPGQKKKLCVPYCFFIFLCNMTADGIYLGSWEILRGGITVIYILAAACFALLSAAASVLLEWYFPIRDWKLETDLWHHPRKYVVPVLMLLIAGAVAFWEGQS